jgi:hypothetical protein
MTESPSPSGFSLNILILLSLEPVTIYLLSWLIPTQKISLECTHYKLLLINVSELVSLSHTPMHLSLDTEISHLSHVEN